VRPLTSILIKYRPPSAVEESWQEGEEEETCRSKSSAALQFPRETWLPLR